MNIEALNYVQYLNKEYKATSFNTYICGYYYSGAMNRHFSQYIHYSKQRFQFNACSICLVYVCY